MSERRFIDSLSRQDIPAAIGLLSRLPVRVKPEDAAKRGAHSAWAYPIAGLVIGLIAAAFGWVALGLGMGPTLAALAVVGAAAVVTGGLHEDGLADTADGIGGGTSPERRLEIMADSAIGAFGVLALILVVSGRVMALSAIISTGVVFAPVVAAAALSRLPMVLMMQALPPVRPDGLSARVGAPGRATVWWAVIVAVLIGAFCLGGGVFMALIAVAIAAGAMAYVASSRIGGQTGDILGATQQLSELAVLAAIVAAL